MVHGQDLKVNNKPINWIHLKEKKKHQKNQQEADTTQLQLFRITYNFSNWFPSKHSGHCFLKPHKTLTTEYLLLSHTATPGFTFVITFVIWVATCRHLLEYSLIYPFFSPTITKRSAKPDLRTEAMLPLGAMQKAHYHQKANMLLFIHKWGNSKHEIMNMSLGAWVHSTQKYLLQNLAPSLYIRGNVEVKHSLPYLFVCNNKGITKHTRK